MTAKRIYKVDSQQDVWLIEATSKAQAIGHVVRGKFEARVATQADLVEALSLGVKVEKASEE